MPQVDGAPLGQHTISMFHTQNAMLLSKAPATWKYAMGGGKPMCTAKEKSHVRSAGTPENFPSMAT